MDEITRDLKEGGVKEIFYANDLFFYGDDWTKVENRYSTWKRAMKEKCIEETYVKQRLFVLVFGRYMSNFRDLYVEKGLKGTP